jgi:hypothetical protein
VPHNSTAISAVRAKNNSTVTQLSPNSGLPLRGLPVKCFQGKTLALLRVARLPQVLNDQPVGPRSGTQGRNPAAIKSALTETGQPASCGKNSRARWFSLRHWVSSDDFGLRHGVWSLGLWPSTCSASRWISPALALLTPPAADMSSLRRCTCAASAAVSNHCGQSGRWGRCGGVGLV